MGRSARTKLGQRLGLLPFLLGGLWAAIPTQVQAQLIPDTTLPNNTVVTPELSGTVQNITGGTTVGNNLFHSFQTFSVPDGTTAAFQNTALIQNILTRVTGSSISQIDGVLQANGTANLFLLNPNGILFGETAQLNLGGSFIGSSAAAIEFQDGTQFSATAPQPTPLLTISAPVGLQFGTNPGPVTVQGPGNQLFADFMDVPFIDDTFRPPGLAVQPGQTLALIGGDLGLPGGNLTAIDGRIELGSVQSPDRVGFVATPAGLTFNYDQVQTFGDIDLSQAASVEVSGEGMGFIQVQGHNITLTDGSTLLARTLGTANGGGLIVNASGTLSLTGFSIDPFGPALPTSLLTDVAPTAVLTNFAEFAEGSGSPLTVNADHLVVADGAFISSGTFEIGNAGPLSVTAQTVDLSGGGPFGSSGLFTDTYGPGRGGELNLTTQTLTVTDGAQISSSTLFGSPLGSGPAGNMTIRADTIALSGGDVNLGGSGLFSIVDTDQPGGNITLNTNQLTITGGAQVSTITFFDGDGGDLTVNANTIDIQGSSPDGFGSGLFSTVELDFAGEGAFGNGGQLTVVTDQLRVAEGGQVTAGTFGFGDAGAVQITAETIELIGIPTTSTAIVSNVETGAAGNGGLLEINTNSLRVLDGAQIAVSTAGSGNAGDLRVQAQTIELIGGDQVASSGLLANAIEGTGAGGNLLVTTDRLTLRDQATISASNFASVSSSALPGQGPAGNVEVQANTIDLDQQASITASTAIGDRGNLTLTAPFIRLNQSSSLTANATGPATGGNITLNTEFLIAQNNSDITANAEQSFGGRVTINATSLFGLDFRNQLTPGSDITASSELGAAFSGVVEINTPENDPSKSLVGLPDAIVDASNQIHSACGNSPGNTFVITGRGGVPADARQPLATQRTWLDLRLQFPEQYQAGSPSAIATQRISSQPTIVEAQGWIRNAQGQLELVNYRAQGIPTHIAAQC